MKREGPPFAAAALLLASSAAGLGLAEGGARVWEWSNGYQYYSRSAMRPVSYSLSLFRDSVEFGYEPVPHMMGHNALGFHNPDHPPRKRPGVFRVMLAGDSLAGNYGDALREEIARLMPPGRELELWNLGVGGYNLSQYARRLRRRGLQYEPDLVVLFHCLNDLDQGVPVLLKRRDRFEEARGLRQTRLLALPGATWLWRRSALYRVAALTALDPKGRAQPPLPEREEHARRELAQVLEDCRRAGAPVVSVLFPLLMPEKAYKHGWQQEGRAMFPGVLRAAGIPYLDLQPLIPEHARIPLRETPGDYIHMSRDASRPYMRLVAGWLKERTLLPQAR